MGVGGCCQVDVKVHFQKVASETSADVQLRSGASVC